MKKKGFALVTVVMIVTIMMVLLFGAMSLTSQTILFIGNFKHRTAALYVAESGIAYAMKHLENNPGTTAVITGSMANSTGDFSVEVDNNLASTGKATLTSTGKVGMFQRKVQVTVELESGSFFAMASDGPISFDGTVFINAISSVLNPKLETGNVHTNYTGAQDAISAGLNFVLDITGKCSAVGTITDQIPDENKEEHASIVNLSDLDKNELLSVNFVPGATIPSDGIISQHTQLEGDVTINGMVELKDGAVLYIKNGNLTINGGIVGTGSVVVEGNTVVKGAMEIKTENTDGIAFYSEGDVTLAHPLVTVTNNNDGTTSTSVSEDAVSEYFAQMPEFAPLYITHNLPDSAGSYLNSSFFEWYSNNQNSQDADYLLWKNGDGTAANPGLPTDVVQWLNNSVGITDQIVNHE